MENTNKSLKKYQGNVEITPANSETWEKKLRYTESISGSVYVSENAKASFPKLESISGSVYVRENAKASFPKLESISGYVDVRENEKLERQFWKIASKNQWYVSDKNSEWLLSQKGNFIFRINEVNFPEELFHKVRKDELSASEVFGMENAEQRRAAYEKMDKLKMKDLPGLKVEDEVKDDGYGYPMKVISFKSDKFDTPFYFLNCFDASTGREYFVETRQMKCWKAKMDSFGLQESDKFDEEW